MGSDDVAWKAVPPGECQAYEGHGVWVPPGMTSREIVLGAKALERDFEVDFYRAQAMVRSIFWAILPNEKLPSQTEGKDHGSDMKSSD